MLTFKLKVIKLNFKFNYLTFVKLHKMKLFIIFNILAIVLFGSFQTSFAKPNEKNLKKVIIVGAGISGLSAANTLLEKGFNNFLILEAHNRIGGRINTIKYSKQHLISKVKHSYKN